MSLVPSELPLEIAISLKWKLCNSKFERFDKIFAKSFSTVILFYAKICEWVCMFVPIHIRNCWTDLDETWDIHSKIEISALKEGERKGKESRKVLAIVFLSFWIDKILVYEKTVASTCCIFCYYLKTNPTKFIIKLN